MTLGRIQAVALAALVVLSSVGGIVGTAVATGGGLDYGDGDAPMVYLGVDKLTVEEWNNEEFDSPLEYYNDNSKADKLPASVNRSDSVDDLGTGTVNPLTFTATNIDEESFAAFPRKGEGGNAASALDAGEWSVSGATVSDVTTAQNVEAVRFSGAASSDSATYSNVSITSDAEKRYLSIAADISSASGTPTLKIEDSDADYVIVELYNSSADADAQTVLANSSGEGKVLQVQLGKLTIKGSGDGTLNEIQSITISGDVTADFALFDAGRTSKIKFGEKRVDTDSDDEFETKSIYQPHGKIDVYAMDTLGPELADATIRNLNYPAKFSAADLPDGDVKATFSSDNAYPQWDSVANIYYRLSLPDQFDVQYSGVSLDQSQQWPATRYVEVQIAEGVSDTKFSDISSWSAVTGSLDTQGKTVTHDSTISTSQQYAVSVDLKLTSSEASAMQAAASSSGGGGGIVGGGSGGLLGALLSPFSLLAVAVTGVFARVRGLI